ncbi:HpcH/HpaI aldolase/citrate lyase family protein [Aneurinibacillus tyrosinisolvens]|uniref:HpcH/HpaI aldolase/citrate lyase family protein n=1 Tax=Aneurinibacillus tyrosinisolvens TaxID=1443435 RepID=UPI00063F74CA|nr:CoA ester lyase [Aneurinibacillus tyrosinisolvens]
MPLWRSWMFIPGNQERKLAKAAQTEADVIIYDLEDAVPIEEKKQARQMVKQALTKKNGRETFVRINDLSTPYFMDDIQEMVGYGADGIMLPKTGKKEDIDLVDYLLRAAEMRHGRKVGETVIMPLIESASGLHHAFDIAKASDRIRCLAFGSVDYTLDVYAELTKEGTEILFARSWLVNVSRAAGIHPPIDGVYVDIQDEEGLKKEAKLIKQLGFQGKLALHPKQNVIINDVFLPSEEEIKLARRITQAFDEAIKQGIAAIQVNGKMVDYPVAMRARKMIEQMEALGSSEREEKRAN